MRTIETTSRFDRDLRRLLRSPQATRISLQLQLVLERLASDLPLEPRRVDHALLGNWADHRDCHVLPDLVLIYRTIGTESLLLARLGSHSELGL